MQSWEEKEESSLLADKQWERAHPDKERDPLTFWKLIFFIGLFAVFLYGNIYAEDQEKYVVQCPICHSCFWVNSESIIHVEGKVIEGCFWKCLTCGNLQTNFSSICLFCGSPK